MEMDGEPEIAAILGGEVMVFLTRREGAWTPKEPPLRLSASGTVLLSGDLDADGGRDLVANKDVFLTAGGAGLILSQELPHAGFRRGARLSDFDFDGDIDFLGGDGSGVFTSRYLGVFRNLGDGKLVAPFEVDLNGYAMAVTSVDLNGDQVMDIVTVLENPVVLGLLLGTATGGYQTLRTLPAILLSPVTQPRGALLESADFDHDSSPDLVYWNESDAYLQFALGDGGGDFPRRRSVEISSPPLALTVGDLEGDGDLDVLASDMPQGSVTPFHNDGEGRFRIGQSIWLGRTTFKATLVDLNRDQVHELIAPDPQSPGVVVVPGLWSTPSSSDLDQNGTPDDCQRDQQLLGDCDQSGAVNISDPICILRVLFTDQLSGFPCGDGKPGHLSNVTHLDVQGDGALDLTDAIVLLRALFLEPEIWTSRCRPIESCPSNPGCPVPGR